MIFRVRQLICVGCLDRSALANSAATGNTQCGGAKARGGAIFPIYFKLRGLLRQTNLGRLVMHKQFQAVAKRIFLHSPYQYPVTGQCAIATLLA